MNQPRRRVTLRGIASFASFAAFAAVVVGGLFVLGSISPAHADDQSRAVDACRISVSQQVAGTTPRSFDLERVGGGGRRYKVWLSAEPDGNQKTRQFYCLVTRSGTVEEVSALSADGTPGENLLAAR